MGMLAYKMSMHPHLLNLSQNNKYIPSFVTRSQVCLLAIKLCLQDKKHVSLYHQKYESILKSTVIILQTYHPLFLYTMYSQYNSRSHQTSNVRFIFNMVNIIEVTPDPRIHPVFAIINLNSNTPMHTNTHRGTKPSGLLHLIQVIRQTATTWTAAPLTALATLGILREPLRWLAQHHNRTIRSRATQPRAT